METITFFSEETTFELSNQNRYTDWIFSFTGNYQKKVERLTFVFCSDDYLLKINQQYLNHDYYTDIITFDYCEGVYLSGDIFISIDRVKENAQTVKIAFEEELMRVMAHGVLHLIGFKDKSENEQLEMRAAEDLAIKSFNQQ